MHTINTTKTLDATIISDEPFAQSDWEFELDVMSSASSHSDLIKHLAKGISSGIDMDTISYLKSYLQDQGVSGVSAAGSFRHSFDLMEA
jgi:hypothetical protein